MTYIQRELERLERALDNGGGNQRYAEIYAARQALAWAVDPEAFRAPCAYLTCTQEGSAGYPAGPDQLPS